MPNTNRNTIIWTNICKCEYKYEDYHIQEKKKKL